MRWRRNTTLTLLFFLISGCTALPKPTETEQSVIVVRIPPAFDPRLSAGENHCRFNLWRYGEGDEKDVSAACKGAGLPNDGVPLLVRLDEAGDVFLNNEPNGNSANLKPLSERLAGIFEERRSNHVYEPGSSKIEMGVGIKMPASTKYSDAISIVRAVKDSQAEPIILYLDGYLPEQIYAEIKN